MNPEGEGVSGEDLNVVARMVLKLGGYAEGLFSYHDFGLDRGVFRQHVNGVYEVLRQMQSASTGRGVGLGRPYVPDAAYWEDPGQIWNYMQALRFAVGVSLGLQKYRRWMSREHVECAVRAKILHNCLMGMLDDIIDRGEYTYIEAKDIHHLVLSSMIDPKFDGTSFMKRLMSLLNSSQVQLFDLMNTLTRQFNTLWNASPHGTDYFYHMELLDDRVALAQAVTTLQKDPHFAPAQLKRIASSFHAPADDVGPWERLAAHISASTRYNLIDMAYSDRSFDLKSLRNFLDGWYYFDSAITLLDHVTSVYKDLRGGIANLSLLTMRESELESRTALRGYLPELTNEEYERHVGRIASLASRGLRLVVRDFTDMDGYYPFLAIMMPVVLMADWIGNRDDMLHAYVREVAPAIREAAQSGSHEAASTPIPGATLARG